MDGSLTANGQDGEWAHGGGGSGGSIWVTAGTLEGSGVISTDGGDSGGSAVAGGGGGGRIALYYDTNVFAGSLSAYGGSGNGAGEPGGAGTIYVADKLPERLDAARKFGADATCLVPQGDFVRFVLEKTRGRGVDVVVEAAGEVEAARQTPHLAAIHGLVVIEGIPPASEVPVNVDLARRRELRVVFGRRSVNVTDRALGLIESGEFDPAVLITHEFPLSETQSAFEHTRDYKDGVIKAIVKP